MDPALVGVVAAVVAAGASFLGIAWRLSGRITTSAASELWAENTKIKQEYRTEIDDLRRRLVALERRNNELHAENGGLQHTIDEHERTISTLRTEVEHLRAENAEMKERVAAMEKAT